MVITKIEPLDKRRCKVFSDEGLAFVLYKGELRRAGIEEGCELAEEKLIKIKEQVLLKRGKERALYILKTGDKSEAEIKKKLRHDLYPEDVIERIISFLKEYGLADDERYCMNMISSMAGKKSLRGIKEKLMQKGISREAASDCINEYFSGAGSEGEAESSERSACMEALRKKLGLRGELTADDPRLERLAELDERERNKIYMSLMRKGFSFELISSLMRSLGQPVAAGGE